MRSLSIIISLTLLSSISFCEIPDYHEFPVFKIDLDLAPEERFIEAVTALKEPAQKMFKDYLHLAPRFIRNFFKDNEDVIKLRHLDIYREITSISEILEMDTYLVLMLNYAFELDKALCTSIVARTPDQRVIHGRNMDFAFADAVRNASYVGEFYQNGEYVFSSVMFAGYQGVHTAFKEGAYSFTMNARSVDPDDHGVKKYFRIMGEIYLGYPEIGIAAREGILASPDYDSLVAYFEEVETIVPIYVILAGMEPNQGLVMSKGLKGSDNIRYLDEDNWYLVQTNDDHFAGVCLERCQDANTHMQAIGEENITIENLLEDVMLQSHTINVFTIWAGDEYDRGKD